MPINGLSSPRKIKPKSITFAPKFSAMENATKSNLGQKNPSPKTFIR